MNGREYKTHGYNPNNTCFAHMTSLLEIAQILDSDNTERHRFSLL